MLWDGDAGGGQPRPNEMPNLDIDSSACAFSPLQHNESTLKQDGEKVPMHKDRQTVKINV